MLCRVTGGFILCTSPEIEESRRGSAAAGGGCRADLMVSDLVPLYLSDRRMLDSGVRGGPFRSPGCPLRVLVRRSMGELVLPDCPWCVVADDSPATLGIPCIRRVMMGCIK